MSTKSRSRDTKPEFWIAYDGECPFCSAYVKLTRLRANAGDLQLIDARSGHSAMVEIEHAGLDINQGMVVKYQGRLYHGADAMHVISLLSSKSTIFNSVMVLIFSNRTIARFLYPILRSCRNLTLRLMGRRLIERHAPSSSGESDTR